MNCSFEIITKWILRKIKKVKKPTQKVQSGQRTW